MRVSIDGLLVCIFLAGLGVVLSLLLLHHDLRGWMPERFDRATIIVQATRTELPAFEIGQCLPGTVSPWNEANAEEYQGSATVAVLTCRSKASFFTLLFTYLAIGLVILLLRRCVPVRRLH
ncbi:MAG: hypothetical protein V4808_02875 [Pseudomonadota bacterium]